ncbi:MAG TPA: hypothetical protein VHL80_07285 [Polyangia bacterium]|nr:hypothetical protein [Polyangia bacterium]
MTRARACLTVIVASLAAAGCFPITYRARQTLPGDPAVPAARAESVKTWDPTYAPGTTGAHAQDVVPVVTGAGFDATDESGERREYVLWGVRLDGGPGTEVVAMMWSPASAPRCQGGHPAYDLLLDRDRPKDLELLEDGLVHWERPFIVEGSRVVFGRFDQDPPLLHRASVVDLTLRRRDAAGDHEVCVRVPVTGPGVTYWSTKRWSLGYRIALRRAQAFTPGSTFSFSMGLGRWLGPVRLGLEAGITGTNNDAPDKGSPAGTWLCFTAPGPDCETANLGTFALDASGPFARWGRYWGLAWSLGYEVSFGALHRLDPATGDVLGRHVGAGGPRVGLRLFAGIPDLDGVSPFSPTSAWSVELFAAAAQEYYGAAGGHPLSYGVAVVGF